MVAELMVDPSTCSKALYFAARCSRPVTCREALHSKYLVSGCGLFFVPKVVRSNHANAIATVNTFSQHKNI